MNLISKKYFIAIGFLILLFSCSDKVDLKVPQTKTRIVFDGILTDSVGFTYVKITKSIDFSDKVYPVITDAKVEVILNESTSIPFIYDEQYQVYKPLDPKFRGQYGNTYKLKVLINNQVYMSSIQALPKKVPPFNEFAVYEEGNYPRFETILKGSVLLYSLVDKDRDGDFYRWQFWINGVYQSTGSDIKINGDETLPQGDSVITNRPVSLREPDVKYYKIVCRQSRINKDIAEFWDQFSNTGQSQGGPFDTTPDPPVSNIKNQNNLSEEVFGIFSAESFIADTLEYTNNNPPKAQF